MRRWVTGGLLGGAALIVALAALTPGRSADRAPASERTLTATGVGIVKAKADGARVLFGVRATNATFGAAQEETQKAAKKLLEAVAALKVDGLEVRTGPMEAAQYFTTRAAVARLAVGGAVAPAAPANQTTHTVGQGYVAVLKDTDFDRLQRNANAVLAAAAENGSNMPGPSPTSRSGVASSSLRTTYDGPSAVVVYFKQADGDLRRLALSKAVSDALANAKALAQGADVQIADVMTLAADPDSPGRSAYYPPDEFAPLTADPGEIEIVVQARVTCKF